MGFDERLDASLGVARQTIDSLRRHRVPATPNNYLVWYAHHAGDNPALSRVLRALEDHEAGFTEERCAELYDRFFGYADETKAIQDATEQIGDAMSKLVGEVKTATADATVYSDALNSFGECLALADGKPSVIRLAQEMAAKTSAMRERADSLARDLQDSASEIESLRAELIEAQKEANTDGLTGIANRRKFDASMRQAVAESLSEGEPLSLVLCDIDHFKRFNDKYGHQIGDLVLRLVAQKLDHAVKVRDTVARYGGEEFAIVLPKTELDAAITLSEQIRQSIAVNRIKLKRDERDLGAITLSMGVAQYRDNETVAGLLARADAALYQAKSEGRNVVRDERALGHAAPAPDEVAELGA